MWLNICMTSSCASLWEEKIGTSWILKMCVLTTGHSQTSGSESMHRSINWTRHKGLKKKDQQSISTSRTFAPCHDVIHFLELFPSTYQQQSIKPRWIHDISSGLFFFVCLFSWWCVILRRLLLSWSRPICKAHLLQNKFAFSVKQIYTYFTCIRHARGFSLKKSWFITNSAPRDTLNYSTSQRKDTSTREAAASSGAGPTKFCILQTHDDGVASKIRRSS